MNLEKVIFNEARQIAFQSFYSTIDEFYGKKDISEKVFQNKWYENLRKNTNIIADGWYNPPPKGMAVLFGQRVSFNSLRKKENWVSENIINWENDLLYAYCSPIDKLSGVIGDMSLTLYFGKDEKIKNHIRNCYEAVQAIFQKLENLQSSRKLFFYSQQVLAEHKLKNCIISQTDQTPLDLGHSFPKLENLKNKESLTDDEKQKISKARKFINQESDWQFEENMQFSIEPQLISIEDLSLPQISQHFLVKKTDEGFLINQDVEQALERYYLK